MAHEEGEYSVFYKCDPEKNVKCSKRNCYINGGPCTQTVNIMYSKENTNATMVIPMSQETYDSLDKNADGTVTITAGPQQSNRAERRKNKHGGSKRK